MGSFNQITKAIERNISDNLPGIAAQIKMAPTFRGGNRFQSSSDKTSKNSAILISIFPDNGNAKTLLIKRAIYKGAHSGQISFPGGKEEESDSNLIQTALREAEEEVGIIPSNVKVIGTLTPLFIPVSNLMVLPVVGIIPFPDNLHLNLQEVEYTITADLNDFKREEKKSVKTICINNVPISAPHYSIGNEMVWGATAMIISEFAELY